MFELLQRQGFQEKCYDWLAGLRYGVECIVCQLCKRNLGVENLLFSCPFTQHIWNAVKDWLMLLVINPASWEGFHTSKIGEGIF
jgi:hypothetical protein